MTHPNRRQPTRRKHEPRASIVKSARRADEFSYRVVDHAERIVLSGHDSARVLKLLENPPKPTKALLAAARRRARSDRPG